MSSLFVVIYVISAIINLVMCICNYANSDKNPNIIDAFMILLPLLNIIVTLSIIVLGILIHAKEKAGGEK